ncbi:AmmeMemoRadiSam system protein B [bacterium]|nr:MAG: AmmeMemoRadiSam system protein B [bacterium]
MARIRQPAVAGQFYPLSPEDLRKQIESFSEKNKSLKPQKEAIGCVLPHAGYMYSGAVAYAVISGIKLKDNLIIIGPNHTGMGEPFSIMDEGVWQLPFGRITVNSALAKKLLFGSSLLRADSLAHQSEHSIEVELALLQYFRRDFTFVPIVVAGTDLENYRKLGLEIASVVKEARLEKDTLLIASSDMTHYEEAASAKKKDSLAIEAMLALDESRLWSRVRAHDISMCGYGPAIAMLSYAKSLGARSAEMVAYQNSGDTTGDYSSVVGYAGITVS